ncbi:MAG TPA: carboxypeptidase regulatory-like domain-containing protein [Acidisarcina sp.]
MARKFRRTCNAALGLALALACTGVGRAQFNSSIQGVVHDTTGAAIPKANVQLINAATKETRSTTSDGAGNFNFASISPGAYSVIGEASGFKKSQNDVTLLTEQNLNIEIALQVGSTGETVTVTTDAPIVDTADSRTELTLDREAVAQLPIAGRNLVTLVTLAPGVSGLGTGALAGTPGSGSDNFSTEEAVDASANGQGSDNNQYIVDGLDVTSGIRQGVLNLTPTPDSIQETSIQVNTFSSQYSRAAGLQTVFTTKSGTSRFHGSAADYFNYQKMFAKQHFSGAYKPFHENDLSFAVGGPVVPHHKLFFWFAVEPKRSSISAGGTYTFADPQFLAFTRATPALAGTIGTHILNTYLPVGLSNPTVVQTAQQVLGTGVNGCNTAATDLIPCGLPMIDSGFLGATAIRNGTQYFGRLDQDFNNDRVYASIYRTLLTSGSATATPQFSTLNPTFQVSPQITWSHTFTPNTLNDVSFGVSRVEGNLGTGAKDYTVPDISTDINMDGGQAFGVGFAQGDFIQHNYHWRDVLTHVAGAHVLKFGYEGWYGDDVENFEGPWATPSFGFNNILTLAQDSPNGEGGVFYNPATGKQQLASWDAASRTFGLFAEDTWKARKNLTLTLGLRYDDSGNPYSQNASTVFGNFYLGTGNTEQQKIANGFAKATHNALLHSVNNLFSPRVGFSWDPTGAGTWVVRGGGGLYNNWLTSANVQEEFRGSPPGLVSPGFIPGGTATAQAPIFALGNSNKAPFGFTYPTFQGGLNSQGGVVGARFNIGAIDPNLKSPKANVWSLAVERRIGQFFAASVGYSGSHSYNIVGAGNNTGGVSYGVNINVVNDDLITHESLNSTGLNPSFGAITYAKNDRYGNYEGVYVDFKGRFSRGFFEGSYTHSSSKDDAGAYPTPDNPGQYYGPSLWDVPNRVSLSFNYELRGLNGERGLIGRATSGWGISGTSIYQSGEPFTVANFNNYQPICANAGACPTFANPAIGYGPNSGDYNADGVNLDYPNASSYKQNTSRSAFLNGSIPLSDFTVPTFGSGGTEKTGQFREPNFAETDANFYKETPITERIKFQIRFECFNLFNRPNLLGVDNNLPDGNFGKATQSHLPRFVQIGGRLYF